MSVIGWIVIERGADGRLEIVTPYLCESEQWALDVAESAVEHYRDIGVEGAFSVSIAAVDESRAGRGCL